MAMMVPDEARTLFRVLTGEEWPDANEDHLRLLAEAWEAAGLGLGDQVSPLLRQLTATVRADFAGDAEKAFVDRVAPFVEGGDQLTAARDRFTAIAAFLRNLALDVEYVKLVSVISLVLLVAEIAWASAMAPWTGGASLGWLSGRIAAVRSMLHTLLGRLLSNILEVSTVMMSTQLLPDLLAQTAQFAGGHRTGWDHAKTRDAAGMAALASILMLPAGPALHHLTKAIGNAADTLLDTVTAMGKGHRAVIDDIIETAFEGGFEGFVEALYSAITTGKFELNPFSVVSGVLNAAAVVVSTRFATFVKNYLAGLRTPTGPGPDTTGLDTPPPQPPTTVLPGPAPRPGPHSPPENPSGKHGSPDTDQSPTTQPTVTLPPHTPGQTDTQPHQPPARTDLPPAYQPPAHTGPPPAYQRDWHPVGADRPPAYEAERPSVPRTDLPPTRTDPPPVHQADPPPTHRPDPLPRQEQPLPHQTDTPPPSRGDNPPLHEGTRPPIDHSGTQPLHDSETALGTLPETPPVRESPVTGESTVEETGNGPSTENSSAAREEHPARPEFGPRTGDESSAPTLSGGREPVAPTIDRSGTDTTTGSGTPLTGSHHTPTDLTAPTETTPSETTVPGTTTPGTTTPGTTAVVTRGSGHPVHSPPRRPATPQGAAVPGRLPLAKPARTDAAFDDLTTPVNDPPPTRTHRADLPATAQATAVAGHPETTPRQAPPPPRTSQQVLRDAPAHQKGRIRQMPGVTEVERSAFEVRRAEVDGQTITEVTVVLDIDSPERDQILRDAQNGVEIYFTNGARLPNGDLLRVLLVPAAPGGKAHHTVRATDGPVTQTRWRAGLAPAVYAHEVGHMLGLPDENSSRISVADSLMGHGPTTTTLPDRYLQVLALHIGDVPVHRAGSGTPTGSVTSEVVGSHPEPALPLTSAEALDAVVAVLDGDDVDPAALTDALTQAMVTPGAERVADLIAEPLTRAVDERRLSHDAMEDALRITGRTTTLSFTDLPPASAPAHPVPTAAVEGVITLVEGGPVDVEALFGTLNRLTGLPGWEQGTPRIADALYGASDSGRLSQEDYDNAMRIIQWTNTFRATPDPDARITSTAVPPGGEAADLAPVRAAAANLHAFLHDSDFDSAVTVLAELGRDMQAVWAVEKAYQARFASTLRGDLLRLRPSQDAYVDHLLGHSDDDPVSRELADAWYAELERLTFAHHSGGPEVPIPFDYAEDGCYIRAHLMAMALQRLGAAPRKVFVARTDPLLSPFVGPDNTPVPTVRWRYHVAPVVLVWNGDEAENMVFDPSLQAGPLTVPEWLTRTGLKPESADIRQDDHLAAVSAALHKHKTDNPGKWSDGFPTGGMVVLTSVEAIHYGDLVNSRPADFQDADARTRRRHLDSLHEYSIKAARRRADARLVEILGMGLTTGGPAAPWTRQQAFGHLLRTEPVGVRGLFDRNPKALGLLADVVPTDMLSTLSTPARAKPAPVVVPAHRGPRTGPPDVTDLPTPVIDQFDTQLPEPPHIPGPPTTQPAELPANVPIQLPADVPAQLPADVPAQLPTSTLNQPTTPTTDQLDTQLPEPPHIPGPPTTQPAELPADVPALTPHKPSALADVPTPVIDQLDPELPGPPSFALDDLLDLPPIDLGFLDLPQSDGRARSPRSVEPTPLNLPPTLPSIPGLFGGPFSHTGPTGRDHLSLADWNPGALFPSSRSGTPRARPSRAAAPAGRDGWGALVDAPAHQRGRIRQMPGAGEVERSAFEVRRGEVGGQATTEITIVLDIDSPDRAQILRDAQDGVDAYFPHSARLSNGDLLRVRLTLGDNAHHKIHVSNGPVTQTRWRAGLPPAAYAHEVGHMLGLPDENSGTRGRLALPDDLMGDAANPPPATIPNRYLRVLELHIGEIPPHTGDEPGAPTGAITPEVVGNHPEPALPASSDAVAAAVAILESPAVDTTALTDAVTRAVALAGGGRVADLIADPLVRAVDERRLPVGAMETVLRIAGRTSVMKFARGVPPAPTATPTTPTAAVTDIVTLVDGHGADTKALFGKLHRLTSLPGWRQGTHRIAGALYRAVESGRLTQDDYQNALGVIQWAHTFPASPDPDTRITSTAVPPGVYPSDLDSVGATAEHLHDLLGGDGDGYADFDSAVAVLAELGRDMQSIWAVADSYQVQFDSELLDTLVRLQPRQEDYIRHLLGATHDEPVSLEQARVWYAELARLTFDHHVGGPAIPVPFDYPRDGCYIRAHLMAMALQRLGASPRKVFVARKTPPLSPLVGPGRTPVEDVNWSYHVAPVVLVRDGDVVEEMVFDPSLDAGVLTVDEWTARTGVPPATVVLAKSGTVSEVSEFLRADKARNPRLWKGNHPVKGALVVLTGVEAVHFQDLIGAAPKSFEEADLRTRDEDIDDLLEHSVAAARRRADSRLVEITGMALTIGGSHSPGAQWQALEHLIRTEPVGVRGVFDRNPHAYHLLSDLVPATLLPFLTDINDTATEPVPVHLLDSRHPAPLAGDADQRQHQRTSSETPDSPTGDGDQRHPAAIDPALLDEIMRDSTTLDETMRDAPAVDPALIDPTLMDTALGALLPSLDATRSTPWPVGPGPAGPATVDRDRADAEAAAILAALGAPTTRGTGHDRSVLADAPAHQRGRVRQLPGVPEVERSAFEVRRGVADGRTITEVTVVLAIEADPATRDRVLRDARLGVDTYVNRPGAELPGGDLLRVRLVAAGPGDRPHHTIRVTDGPVTRTHWRTGLPPAVYAHEVGHMLGLPDENSAVEGRLSIPDSLMGHGPNTASPTFPGRYFQVLALHIGDVPVHDLRSPGEPSRTVTPEVVGDHPEPAVPTPLDTAVAAVVALLNGPAVAPAVLETALAQAMALPGAEQVADRIAEPLNRARLDRRLPERGFNRALEVTGRTGRLAFAVAPAVPRDGGSSRVAVDETVTLVDGPQIAKRDLFSRLHRLTSLPGWQQESSRLVGPLLRALGERRLTQTDYEQALQVLGWMVTFPAVPTPNSEIVSTAVAPGEDASTLPAVQNTAATLGGLIDRGDYDTAVAVLTTLNRDMQAIWAVQRAYAGRFATRAGEVARQLEADLVGRWPEHADYLRHLLGHVHDEPVSLAQAAAWYGRLSELTYDHHSGEKVRIPFDYPEEGCYARAHLMALALQRLGAAPRKVFAIRLSPQLAPLVGPDFTALPITWGYHVAPVVAVEVGGASVTMVFDPALQAGLLTVDEWLARLSVGPADSVSTVDGPVDRVREVLLAARAASPESWVAGYPVTGTLLVYTDPAAVGYDDLLGVTATTFDQADSRFRLLDGDLLHGLSAEAASRRRVGARLLQIMVMGMGMDSADPTEAQRRALVELIRDEPAGVRGMFVRDQLAATLLLDLVPAELLSAVDATLSAPAGPGAPDPALLVGGMPALGGVELEGTGLPAGFERLADGMPGYDDVVTALSGLGIGGSATIVAYPLDGGPALRWHLDNTAEGVTARDPHTGFGWLLSVRPLALPASFQVYARLAAGGAGSSSAV
ncbi:protein-glutamine glutaminase family protein [Actinokineospora sp. 24-640]